MSVGRVTSSMVQRNILADLNAVNQKLALTQERAASGKQITKPSDDPFGTGRAMLLRQALAANGQQQSNVNDALGWQQATETALSSITDAVQRAGDLINQGGSDTADQASRDAIASELEQLVAGVKADANATYDGAYIFSGTATTTAPYLDGPDDAYQGDEGGWNPAMPGIVRTIGPNVSITINSVAREFLGDGDGQDGKLLSTLRKTIADLRAGDGAQLRGPDLDAIKANLDQVVAVRSRNGAQTNRLQSAMDRLQQVQESATSRLSDTEDADIAQTLTDFSQQSAAYTAALRAGASIVQVSLLDFLK